MDAEQREKNLAQRRRIEANRRAWDVAIAAAHMMRKGETPPPEMMAFWEGGDAE